jgi:DNA-binding Lrp family transcriptional regulator
MGLNILEKEDMMILSHLRENARKNLTSISKSTGIPISTIFDKLKKYDGDLIIKHTAMLDFAKLGYEVKVHIMMKVPKENRDDLRTHLLKDARINSVYRINNGYDFMVEAFFKNMKEVNDFSECLEKFKVKDAEEYYVLEEIKKESFMSDPQTVGLL